MSALLPAVLAGAAAAVLLSPRPAGLRVDRVVPRDRSDASPRPTGGVTRGGAGADGAPARGPSVGGRPVTGHRLVPLAAAGALLLAGAGPVPALLAAVSTLAAGRWARSRRVTAHRTAERARAVEACTALAAELRAGRSPAQALEVAAGLAVGPSRAALASAASAAQLGGDVGGALRPPAGTAVPEVLRALSACWTVCAGTGSGLAAAVERLEQGLRADEEQRRAVAAELAGPRATAGMLAALPLAGLLLAAGLGADPLHVLLHTPVGLVCLVTGVGLDVLGLWWTGRLVARAGGRP